MSQARVALLVALVALLASGLPPGEAQSAGAPQVCLDKDPGPSGRPASLDPAELDPDAPPSPPAPPAKQCPGGFPDVPNYLEGQKIGITLRNLDPDAAQPYVRVRCIDDDGSCHEMADEPGDPRRYCAKWTGSALEFPRDFDEPCPGQTEGLSAAEAGGLRYNSTWEVAALVPGAPIVRTLHVWGSTIYRSKNLTLHPGEEHELRYGGVEKGATLQWTFERRAADGEWAPFSPGATPPPATPDGFGVGFHVWRIPKDEATRIQQCLALRAGDCYRVTIRALSSTKAEEVFTFRADVAELAPTHLIGQKADPDAGGQPETVQRTQNVTLAMLFHYPGGRLYQGAPFTPQDLAPVSGPQAPSLRIRVEKQNLSSSTPIQVAEVPLSWASDTGRWQATWTVARDLPIEPDARYTLRLVGTNDRWGNRVPALSLGTYAVKAAALEPVVALGLSTLERTAEGKLGFTIRYLDGSPYTDQDNATPLTGCFVRDSSGVPPACPPPGGSVSVAAYENGTWVFRARYDREYEGLGAHKLVLSGGARDKWGNSVDGTTTEPFEVTVASPRIDFQTVMRGRATTDLERGERVGVTARITYPDGSPFNHTVRWARSDDDPWSRVLNVTVTKRGESGAIQDVQTLALREADARQGLWAGTLELTLDVGQTPAGRWSFALRANDTVDPSNENDTVIDRVVHAAAIRYHQTRLTPSQPFTGSSVLYEFQLHYPGQAGASGPEVPPDAIRSQMTAQAYRWDARARATFGDPVSTFLQPEYAPDRHAWSLRYVVPGNLFNGSYVLALRGGDVSGNLLPQDAWSTPFEPQSLVVGRPALTQPPPSVQRGESATVVFAAKDGDSGQDGSGLPRIAVERWNGQGARWDVVAGGTDARAASPDLLDHFGVFPVTTTTAIGTYRFVLLGREAGPGFALVEGVSDNFTVQPTEVTRAIVRPPQEVATKGDLVWFTIERQEGDRISAVQLLHNGRAIDLPRPQLVVEGDHVNATWRVPFEAPTGNYTIHVEGRDQYGNLLVVDTPGIEAVAAQLQGKVIGNPPKVVKRGERAQILFGVTYPSGAFYNAVDAPSVLVFNDTGLVASAEVNRSGVTFQAAWDPPAAAGVGDYWFEINGQGVGGNAFPSLRSSTFRLAPGTFPRAGASDVPVSVERLATQTWSVPIEAQDRSVSFSLAYYGNTLDTQSVQQKEPLTLTPLPHTADPVAGRYLARFASDQQTPVGAYRVFLKGEDRLGNQIAGRSNVFLVKPTTVIIGWDQQPQQSAFVEGATLKLTFVARYKSGPIMDDTMGRPGIALLLDGQPTTQKPALEYASGHWLVEWTAPGLLKDGTYVFAVGGQDIAGNQIASSKSLQYPVQTPVANSFAKVIPGFEPVLGLLGIAALAALLRRRVS